MLKPSSSKLMGSVTPRRQQRTSAQVAEFVTYYLKDGIGRLLPACPLGAGRRFILLKEWRLTLAPVPSSKWPRSSCPAIWRDSGRLWLRQSRCRRFANRGSASNPSCQDCDEAAIFQGATCCCGKASRSTWEFREPWFNGFGNM